MNELVKTQSCPYCNHDVEDNYAEWEDGTHEVTCDSCGKEYSVETEYQFLGLRIEKICDECREVESECYCDETEVGEETDNETNRRE